MELSDCVSFILLYESLRAHQNSKEISREKHLKTEHEIHITNQPELFKLTQLSGSVHRQWGIAGTSVLTQEAWDTAGSSPLLFADYEDL